MMVWSVVIHIPKSVNMFQNMSSFGSKREIHNIKNTFDLSLIQDQTDTCYCTA
jgi:hypothetical protein